MRLSVQTLAQAMIYCFRIAHDKSVNVSTLAYRIRLCFSCTAHHCTPVKWLITVADLCGAGRIVEDAKPPALVRLSQAEALEALKKDKAMAGSKWFPSLAAPSFPGS